MSRRYGGSLIGIDLDNTLICYDRVFLELAMGAGLVPPGFRGTKRDIRDRVRLVPDGDREWQRLQAQAYGPEIAGAESSDGSIEFIREARRKGARLAIVSHKTRHAMMGDTVVNLHDAARGWLRWSGIVGVDMIAETDVYFEETRAEKIARIVTLGCTHFIDDLQEVLNDVSFPRCTERMHYAVDVEGQKMYNAYGSFREIADAFRD